MIGERRGGIAAGGPAASEMPMPRQRATLDVTVMRCDVVQRGVSGDASAVLHHAAQSHATPGRLLRITVLLLLLLVVVVVVVL